LLQEIMTKMDTLGKAPQEPTQQEAPGPATIERGPDGKVVSVNGVPVKRDEQGRLAGLEE